MELLIIYKISLPPSLPKRGGERRNFSKEGERKGRNVPTISHDRIDFDQLLEKIKKYGLEQEWEKAQKISRE